MTQDITKKYILENEKYYEELSPKNEKVIEIGLTHLTTIYYNPVRNEFIRFFNHECGTVVKVRKFHYLSELEILGLEEDVEKTRKCLEMGFKLNDLDFLIQNN